MTTWFQILLMIGMPFAFPVSVVNETLTDLSLATLQEAQEAGAL